MTLSVEQQQLVEQRLSNEMRSPVIAYLLWFFLGAFGAHRFYLGRVGGGVGMLLLFWLGVFTAVLIVGYIFLLIYFIWWVVDAFLIPSMVDKHRNAKRAEITAEIGISV